MVKLNSFFPPLGSSYVLSFPMGHECSIQHYVFPLCLMKFLSTGHRSTLRCLPKVPKPSPKLREHVELLTNRFRMKCYSRHTAPPSLSSLTARLRAWSRGGESGWFLAAADGACRPGRCRLGPSCRRARHHRRGRPRWGWWAWRCGAHTSPLETTNRRVVRLCVWHDHICTETII